MPPSIFKPGGTPGGSENATQKQEHFQAGWHTRRLGKCDQTGAHFQAGGNTRRLGKCDQTEHFQAGRSTRRLGKCDQAKHFQAGRNARRLGKCDRIRGLQRQLLDVSSVFVPVDACSAIVKPLKRKVSHAHPFPARLDPHRSVPKAISGQVAASDRILPWESAFFAQFAPDQRVREWVKLEGTPSCC